MSKKRENWAPVEAAPIDLPPPPGEPEAGTRGDGRGASEVAAAEAQASRPHGLTASPPYEERADIPREMICAAIPVDLPAAGYVPRHVELQLYDFRQARALRCLCDGLRRSHAQLADGRHIDRPADAIRFLLERVADAIDASAPDYDWRGPK